MSYYIRAFCVDLAPLPNELPAELGLRAEASGAGQAEIHYKKGRSPILAELWTQADANEEIDEFVEALEDVPESSAKKHVVNHLGRTTTVVALRLSNDIDDDGYEMAGLYFAYLVDRAGALIQADGEGFYDGEELILELS
jgi:hypothetical protein